MKEEEEKKEHPAVENIESMSKELDISRTEKG